MKAFSLARSTILSRFEASRALSADYPTDTEFPIEAPNRRFQKPTSGPWGRITVQFGERNQISIGGGAGSGNRKRTAFVLTLQIFVPEHKGEKEAFEIAEQVMGSLDVQSIAAVDIPVTTRIDLFFGTVSFTPVGNVGGGEDEGAAGTAQFNATISGHFDDILTSTP